jgi:hypothetical protein
MDWITRKRGWLTWLFLFFGMACGGGSCSSCEGCGIAPVPGGFPLEERIPNAVQVRLTESGVSFIENDFANVLAALDPNLLAFSIGSETITIGSTCALRGTATICPSGNCVVEITPTMLVLDPQAPNRLNIRIRLEVATTLPVTGTGQLLCLPSFSIGGCDIVLDTTLAGAPYVEATVTVDLAEIIEQARAGYTEIVLGDIEITQSIDNNDIQFNECSGLLSLFDIGFIQDLVKSLVVPQVEAVLDDLIDGMVAEALCMADDPIAGCPTGTVSEGGICKYEPGGKCVPIMLGLDGQGDLGAAFLGGFAPGVHGRLRLLLALGGDGRMRNNGISLSMFGGMQSLDPTLTQSPGHNPCVPRTIPPQLPDVPVSPMLEGNTVPGSGAPAHVGIGVSESYINYSAWHVFDSGMLCIGAGSGLSDLLTTGTLSLFLGSLNRLTFPDANQPIAMLLRPKRPPHIDVGTGGAALLGISLPELDVDMYAWIQERYVRFMTLRTNINIDVDLTVDESGIIPNIGDVQFSGSQIVNSELLLEDPTVVAGMLEGLVPSLVGGLLGDFEAIELPEIEGLVLDVPEGGIQGFSDAGEDFLGIFANLGVAGTQASALLARPVDTSIQSVDLQLDERALRFETYQEADIPTLTAVAAGHGATYRFEYSYRLNGQRWSMWSEEPNLVIQDPLLRFQGRHVLEVRARQAGLPRSTDPTPAREEILVDILPPDIRFEHADGGIRLLADDIVSPRSALHYRHRVDGGDWSEWTPLGDGPVFDVNPDALEVEVRDEVGNVGAAQGSLIRGGSNPDGGDACDCAVPGGGSGNTPAAGLALLLMMGVLLRRRWQKQSSLSVQGVVRAARRALPFLVLPLALAVSATVMGCGGKKDDCGGECEPPVDHDSPNGTVCCSAQSMCVPVNLGSLCPDPREYCRPDAVVVSSQCNVSCEEDGCYVPDLNPGQLATYLDMVALSDGTLVLSGYNPGNPRATPPRPLRDLVVGVYDEAEEEVQWEIVDGVPWSVPPEFNEDGWREGIAVSGPDVGRWSSIAAASNGTLYVSYYDKTNGDLKLAIGRPGGPWAIHVVDDEGDSGQFTSVVLQDGAPRIAYLQMLPGAEAGQRIARARVAFADGANPSSPADWQFTTVDEVVTVAPSLEDLPLATGLFNNLFLDDDGLALVWYDRTGGNIYGSRWTGASWATPLLIDGWATGQTDVGDSGIGASVFVEGNTWHVAYVDGVEETLRYARVDEWTVATRQIVDDGAIPGGGRHVVGDGSAIARVGGELRIVYQDTTAHRALLARGSGAGAWEVSVVDDEGSTGFWLNQLVVGGQSRVATFWMGPGGGPSGVRVFTLP